MDYSSWIEWNNKSQNQVSYLRYHAMLNKRRELRLLFPLTFLNALISLDELRFADSTTAERLWHIRKGSACVWPRARQKDCARWRLQKRNENVLRMKLADYAKLDYRKLKKPGRRRRRESQMRYNNTNNLLSSSFSSATVEFFFYHQSFPTSKCATCFVFMISFCRSPLCWIKIAPFLWSLLLSTKRFTCLFRGGECGSSERWLWNFRKLCATSSILIIIQALSTPQPPQPPQPLHWIRWVVTNPPKLPPFKPLALYKISCG